MIGGGTGVLVRPKVFDGGLQRRRNSSRVADVQWMGSGAGLVRCSLALHRALVFLAGGLVTEGLGLSDIEYWLRNGFSRLGLVAYFFVTF